MISLKLVWSIGIWILLAHLSPSHEAALDSETMASYGTVALDSLGKYLVSWDVYEASGVVRFNIEVETQGYVGFGISTNGTMLGADIIALEGAGGDITVLDYYGRMGQAKPELDDVQDLSMVEASRNGTHTSLKFSRVFDTEDADGDVIIQDEDTYFIWAISRNAATYLEYHGTEANNVRGAFKINILNPTVPTAPPTTAGPTDTPTVPQTTAGPTDTPTVPQTTAGPTDTPTVPQTTAGPTDTPTVPQTTAGPTDTPTVPQTTAAATVPTTPDGYTYPATTEVPEKNISCDFKEILVHPYPPPCYVEFLCLNLDDTITVNDCGFIDFDPRGGQPYILGSAGLSQSEPLSNPAKSAKNIACDFKEILVHPYPSPCYVEFLCHNLDGGVITVNDCGFIDFDP